MKIQILSWGTTFTYMMTKLMITILYNIVYFCIGRTWWKMGSSQGSIGYGMMVAVLNSRARFLYILWVVTLTWHVVAFVWKIVILWACECERELVSMSLWVGWDFLSIFWWHGWNMPRIFFATLDIIFVKINFLDEKCYLLKKFA